MLHPKEPSSRYVFVPKQFTYLFLLSIFIAACDTPEYKKSSSVDYANMRPQPLDHAKGFAISRGERYDQLTLFSDNRQRDTFAVFILLKDSSLRFPVKSNNFVLRSRPKKIASLSCVYSNMISALGHGREIAAVENLDYYSDSTILALSGEGKIKELARQPEMELEQCLLLQPDMVFSFSTGNPINDPYKRIVQAGIPMLIARDDKEESPLARAEWIKLFGFFLQEDKRADSIFTSVKERYAAVCKMVGTAQNRPTVFSEIKFGELWYVPGGKSFMARFITDAGGDYVWKEDSHEGSLTLGLEEVLAKAGYADIWLNQAMIRSKKELTAAEPRYSHFLAYKKGNLYNNILHLNDKGYSDYWETGMMYPDRILTDLAQILHPEIRAQLATKMYYYIQLQ